MRPDMIIMDSAMSDLNGIEAVRQIISEMPKMKVIALSVYAARRLVANVLKAGPSGYLLKDCASKKLVRAIRVVLANKTYLSQRHRHRGEGLCSGAPECPKARRYGSRYTGFPGEFLLQGGRISTPASSQSPFLADCLGR
jgi:DNA-binding NarL/FixJ family response regulator